MMKCLNCRFSKDCGTTIPHGVTCYLQEGELTSAITGEIKNNYDKLLDEMAEEYPELASLYDFVMAEDYVERLRWEYERGGGYKNLIDQAKEKYLIIFQDMGLFHSEYND